MSGGGNQNIGDAQARLEVGPNILVNLPVGKLAGVDESERGKETRESSARFIGDALEDPAQSRRHCESGSEFVSVHGIQADYVLSEVPARNAAVDERISWGGETGEQIDESRDASIGGQRVSKLRAIEREDSTEAIIVEAVVDVSKTVEAEFHAVRTASD